MARAKPTKTNAVIEGGADVLEVLPAPDAPMVPKSDQFDICLPLILKHEGGYADHARDPGGATNLGVSLRYAKARGSLFDLDGDGDVDAADIRLITVETAGPAYRADFWDAVKADRLPAGVDYCVFDYAVNSGPGRAIRALQFAVGATVDGQIGPQTLAAIASTPPLHIVEVISSSRILFMRRLSNWEDFKLGWQRRVQGVMENSHRMILQMPLRA